MSERQIDVILFFLLMSILVWLIPLIVFVFRWIKNYKSKQANIVSMESRLMLCSLSLVGAIWCLRFATSYYEDTTLLSSGLSVAEMFFDSLLHALQTMTMNEECSEFIVLGKTMIADIYGGKHLSFFESFYGIYASILDLLAPVTSAAALFSILTAAFPKLKLKLSFLRKQYYFSELNERSIALARSIVNNKTKFLKHPVLIFTDVYVDDENERSSEFYLIAKKLGAVCVKDDIAHLKIKTFKEKEIFLIDENESDNIKHLSELSSEEFENTLKNTFIYIFYQDDSYALIENKIKTDMIEKHKYSTKPPVITRVKEYENLILDLLSKKPLIEPLLRNYKDGLPYPTGDKTDEYNLTIIGSGKIGLQMLLSSSWCGQFYGYKLNINVVSNESKKDFERNINNDYPEFIESSKTNSHLLRVFNDSDVVNEPYFNLRYGEYDFNKISLSDVNCVSFADNDEKEFNIIDSDYFLIALGNDEANMLAAEKLKKKISNIQYRLEKEKRKNRIVAFAVYNQSFNETLRKRSFDNDYKIEIFPFAGIEETYSYQNITMVNKDPAAILVGNTYISQTFIEKTIEEKRKYQTEQNKKIYDIMSSKSREIHFKYRMFSAFLFNRNDANLDENDEFTSKELYDFDNQTTIETYSNMVLSEEAKEKRDNILQYLTWLEHRRWNAYMRSIGFSYDIKENKNIKLKLHGCLCECSKLPISGYSKIRLDDLKNRVFDYVCNNEKITKKGFDSCIKKWSRLPQSCEQVQVDILVENIHKLFETNIIVLHTDIRLLCQKNQSEIDGINKSNISEQEKEDKIKTIKEELQKELKEKFKVVFDGIVDECVKDNICKLQSQVRLDMLDLTSQRTGSDMKYYDFPQENDINLINCYRQIRKEIN